MVVADGAAAALGLLGALLEDPAIAFVKGAPDGEDRVAELLARPLLNLHVPELAAMLQPLATETAARRTLLERLPFAVGEGIEIGLLIDAHREAGLEGIAQVRLGPGARPAAPATQRALAVLTTAERRIHGAVRADAHAPGHLLVPAGGEFEAQPVALDERPPLSGLPRPAAA